MYFLFWKESFIYHKEINSILLRRERRSKLEIFNDILSTIQDESSYGEVKPTRIAHIENISYENLSKYLDELKVKYLITDSSTLTEKGRKFLQDYERIHNFVVQMKLESIDEKNHVMISNN